MKHLLSSNSDAEDYLCPIDEQDIVLARDFETQLNPLGCSNDFHEIVKILLDDEIPSPSNPQDGYELFLNLMGMLNDIESEENI